MSSDLNAAEGSRWEKIKKDPAPAIGKNSPSSKLVSILRLFIT